MTSGARGYGGALNSAQRLVSFSVAFGKLRRDVGDLAACLYYAVRGDETRKADLLSVVGLNGEPRVDRIKVLALLLAEKDKLRRLTSTVYDVSPLLAYRCHEMWKSLSSGSPTGRGKRLADYFEKYEKRLSWQVGRIYRARNRLAHVGDGAERVRDLVTHAHFYLTQLLAICIHHTESRQRSAQDVLSERAGAYRAFIELLKAEDPTATTPQALTRPSSVVG